MAEVKMLTGAAGCSSSLLLVQVVQGISQYVVGEGGVEGWAAVHDDAVCCVDVGLNDSSLALDQSPSIGYSSAEIEPGFVIIRPICNLDLC